MKFIGINGGTCVGKSSVVKNLLKQRDHAFYLGHDPLKRLFSKYSPQEQWEDVHALMLALLPVVAEKKYDIISDSGLRREWREELFGVARSLGYDVVEINFEAEYRVLEERFDERVARALANPELRVTNTSKDRFKELYDLFQEGKNPSAITFRTDTQSVEEITEDILKLF